MAFTSKKERNQKSVSTDKITLKIYKKVYKQNDISRFYHSKVMITSITDLNYHSEKNESGLSVPV